MATTVKPFVACNAKCTYCYEEPIRDAGNASKKYDLEAMKAAIVHEWTTRRAPPTMHGGEFLLMPKADAEQLFALSYELTGQGSVQTNGSRIDDDWIAMFKRYNVSVGVSIDGPGLLNRGRWMGSAERTDRTTAQVMANLRRMREAGVSVSIICVISRIHAETHGAMQMMKEWLLELRDMGIDSGRINQVEVDRPDLREQFELTPDQLKAIFIELGEFVLGTPGLYWMPFRDIQDMLLGLSGGTCVYTGCDPLATDGEQAIRGDGAVGNCLKTAKEGVEYLRAEDGEQPERSELLANTPYEFGGCQGCRYWKVCHGQCPSEAIDGDYRNRSRYCAAHYGLFEFVEGRMKALFPNLRTVCDFNHLEPDDIALRRKGQSTFQAFSLLTKSGSWAPSAWRGSAWAHARNTSTPFYPDGVDVRPGPEPPSGDVQHGDVSHGDVAHGDHSDSGPGEGGAPGVNPAAWSKVVDE